MGSFLLIFGCFPVNQIVQACQFSDLGIPASKHYYSAVFFRLTAQPCLGADPVEQEHRQHFCLYGFAEKSAGDSPSSSTHPVKCTMQKNKKTSKVIHFQTKILGIF